MWKGVVYNLDLLVVGNYRKIDPIKNTNECTTLERRLFRSDEDVEG
jgi:hypothetical protein